MAAFVRAIGIEAADIDELGHVNNVSYLRWAQEIATAHWRERADAQMLAAYVWVVLRHEIDYRAGLFLGDAIEARTWLEAAPRGALWPRHVEIARVGESVAAASVVSTWCLLDAERRRPRRIPPEMAALFDE